MALFKPFRGTRATLPAEMHDGFAYFCIDDGSFHIDYIDADGNLRRKQINAKDAETLNGKTLAAIEIDVENAINEMGAVSYLPQTLTAEQMAQARRNIGISSEDNPGGISMQKISQESYDALAYKDPNTLYIII